MDFGNFYRHGYRSLRAEDNLVVVLCMRDMLSMMYIYIHFLFTDAVGVFIVVAGGRMIRLFDYKLYYGIRIN